jgi:hypothetical protein
MLYYGCNIFRGRFDFHGKERPANALATLADVRIIWREHALQTDFLCCRAGVM